MKNPTKRNIFDRYQALQHKTEWSLDTSAQSSKWCNGLVLKGFITSPAMDELRAEFDHVYLTEEGLTIR